jgi:quercetin dioxygenase-like cupin family protein
MITKTLIAAAASLFAIGLAGIPADAQDQQVAQPKGIKVKGLVTSLGGFSATVNTPILVTGSTVELEPGGQTGRQEFRVPTYIYVLEGVLTTEYEAGPIGIKGTQYHATGQSFMDNGGVGWWHNLANRSDKPVKYLMLHLGYPGRPDPIQKPDKED